VPISIFIVCAAVMGAGGVALAAAGAHAAPHTGLDSAAYILLFHAAALPGAIALTQQGLVWRPLAIGAVAGFVVGAALFAGSVTLRAFAGLRLFPMAAPTGGTILILAWLTLAAAAIAAHLQRAG
jgi:uncharacterized membrane protein YgdD (TMEM256/DUF423 family)